MDAGVGAAEPRGPVARPISSDDQQRRRVRGGDQTAEQFLRGGVDPVQVLEQDGERRDAATLAQEIDQQAARAQSDQHAVQPGEAPGRRREADKVHQQPDVLGTREANKSQAVFELAHGFRLAVGGIDPEDTANDFDEWSERRLLAVRPAAALQDEHAIRDEDAAKFVKKPRFADARFAGDVDDAKAIRGLSAPPRERV